MEGKRNPRDPIYFFGKIDHESISGLIDFIRLRAPQDPDPPLEVVISSVGGLNSAALGFMSWMQRFDRRDNVRAVATGDVASAAVTLFLAFERRTADPEAVFRFHMLAPELASDDPAVALYVKEVSENMVHLWSERTGLAKEIIRDYMEERIPMSGEHLFKSGICNESPTRTS